MRLKKWTALMLALGLLLSSLAMGVQAEESMAAQEDAVFAMPQAAPEEIVFEEPAAEEEEQMARDEVVLDSSPILGMPSQPHEEVEATAVYALERPAYDRGEGPVYVLENGARHFGQPEEFIPLGKTIYLYNYHIIEISGYSLGDLRNVRWALGGGFSASDAIFLSERSPGGRTEAGVVFLWAGPDLGVRDSVYRLGDVIDAKEDEYLEAEIMVTAENYTEGEPCLPTFRLSAIPEVDGTMAFAVSIDGGEAQVLMGSSFDPVLSGEYRFLLVDASGEELARSRKYSVELPAMASDELSPFMPPMPEEEDVSMGFTVEEDEEEALEDVMERYAGAESSDEDMASDAIYLPESLFTGSDMVEEMAYAESQHFELTVKQLDEVTFELSGLPEDGLHMYTVQVDGGTPSVLLSNVYTAMESGRHIFGIRDVDGDVVAESDAFMVTADALEDFLRVYDAHTLEITPAPDEVPSGWTSKPITFTFSDAPVLAAGCRFAALIDGKVEDTFTEKTYTLSKEGEYTLNFAVVDADDAVLSVSEETYDIKMDLSAPLLIATPMDNYVLRIVVGDVLSHGATVSISVDNGQTFTPGLLKYQGEGVSTCEFVAAAPFQLAPGMIIVADAAGNTTANTAPVVLYSTMAQMGGLGGFGGFGGFSGSRGGFGGSYRAVSHSESDVDDVTAYNAVRLIVDDGSMTQLTVGDEVLDLQLVRKTDRVDPTLAEPAFTADFSAWDGSADGEVDTLILSAADPEEMLDAHRYIWSFSGVVYKKLAASGIDYLVLRIGDNAAVLSTAGFSAGIRYNMYRAEGLPSKAFHYDVSMEGTDFAMDVTVSGDTYRMTADPSAEFYYYDVYSGTADQFGVLAER